MPATKRLEIDRRVGIALSALSPSRRRAVDRVLRSSDGFDELASDRAIVEAIDVGDLPLSMMRVSPSLRLIYRKTSDGYHVLDLVDRATMERFAKSPPKKLPTKAPLEIKPGRPKRKKHAATDS